jgi:N-acetylglucosamine-6-phosphate deacetylase
MAGIPGFIDVQVNGYKGVDFTGDGGVVPLTVESCASACRDYLAEAACVAFCPTIITSHEHEYERTIPMMATVMEMPEFVGRLPGIHLEGPFLSAEDGAKGAHRDECMGPPDIEYFDRLLALARGKVAIMSIAAELPGAAEFTRHAVSKGVTISVGHSLATAEDLAAVAEAGATMITHLGNGMPNMVHRHSNLVMDGCANDQLTAGLITDSFHLPVSILKTILRAKSPARCVVVSDIAFPGGCPPGDFEWSGEVARLEPDGHLHMPGRANGPLPRDRTSEFSPAPLSCLCLALRSIKIAWVNG